MKIAFSLPIEERKNPLYQAARAICDILTQQGHITYFAGGCVRDWLRKSSPSDIDLATSAPAKTVCSLFPKTIRTGMQFESVRVLYNSMLFEVSSFRKDGEYQDGRRPQCVFPGTPEEDASRRDFTINGMFYCPTTEHIFDFVEGLKDLQKQTVRAIGDPIKRFQEDHLRILRAVRFAARLQFAIDSETLHAMQDSAHTLCHVAKERILSELHKICADKNIANAFDLLNKSSMLHHLFCDLWKCPEAGAMSPKACLQYIQEPIPFWLICLFILTGGTYIASETFLAQIISRFLFSSKEQKALRFGVSFGKALQEDQAMTKKALWCRLYSEPWAQDMLKLITKHASIANRLLFFAQEEHIAIEKIKGKKHLLSGTVLVNLGITKQACGKLLEQATELAIQHKAFSEEEILLILQKNQLLPKSPPQIEPPKKIS